MTAWRVAFEPVSIATAPINRPMLIATAATSIPDGAKAGAGGRAPHVGPGARGIDSSASERTLAIARARSSSGRLRARLRRQRIDDRL